MHTIRFPLKTTAEQEQVLGHRFYLMNRVRNLMVSHAKKQLRMLRRDKGYRLLLSEYHRFKTSGDERRRKDSAKQLNQYISQYGLTKGALEKFVSVQQKKLRKHLSAFQCQKEVLRVVDALEDVLYGNGKDIHYKKLSERQTIGGKSVKDGVKLFDQFHHDYWPKRMPIPSTDAIHWNGLTIPVKIKWADPYVVESLNHDVRYCEIERLMFNDGYHYYVIVVLDGDIPKKLSPGEGIMGIDPGVSTEACVSDNSVFLREIAPEITKYNKAIVKLQGQIEISKKKSNPQNYDAGGRYKKGKHKWVFSKTCLRKKRKLTILYRKKASYIRQWQYELIAEILPHADTFIVEAMDFKALQKRTKKTEKQDHFSEVKNAKGETKTVRKYKRKKRYGKSLNNRAPAQFLDLLKAKCKQHGLSYMEVKTRSFKASQYNHVIGEGSSTTLNQREKLIGGHVIQRDLYSAFLISCTDASLCAPDRDLCIRKFPQFLKLHDQEIQRMKNAGISMKQCFGF